MCLLRFFRSVEKDIIETLDGGVATALPASLTMADIETALIQRGKP